MKKNSVLKMILVLMAISLVSGAVLTFANNKLSPIITARESDKMRLVAEELLPEGATITKVTKYADLASLVSSARTSVGLSGSWIWDPNAAPVAAPAEIEPAAPLEPEIDWDAWAMFFTEDEPEADSSELDPWAEFGVEFAPVDNTPKEVVKTWEDFGVELTLVDNTPKELTASWADFGLELTVVDNTPKELVEEVPTVSWEDFGIEVSTVSSEPEPEEEEVPTISWEDLGIEVDTPEIPSSPETTGGAADESLEEAEEAPDFEVYQAVQNGKLVGVAIISKAPGYSGDIVVMLALEGTLEKVIGMQVLQQSETAGLGSKITEEKFTSQFAGKAVGNPFEAGQDIDSVAGATVSSRGVATALRNGLMNLEQFLIDGTVKEGA